MRRTPMRIRRLIAPTLAMLIVSACQPAPTREPLPDVTATPTDEVTLAPGEWTPAPTPTPFQLEAQCALTGSYRLKIDPDGSTLPFADEKLISPDGRFVLRRHGGMVTVQSAEGGDPVNLVEAPAMPYFNYWSPDGNKLA